MADIILKKKLIEDILEFSEANASEGFIAQIGGYLDRNSGKIIAENLLYQGFMENNSAASIITGQMPVVDDVIGTVHNHTARSHELDERDKDIIDGGYGSVHIVAFSPYKKEDVKLYDSQGKELDWVTGD
ncbi:MAG: hypothetical protein ACLFTR_03300 [Candidatus Woesearchaeota archaeon]